MTAEQGGKLRFRESMPKPLMVVFAAFALSAVGVTLFAILSPGGETVGLGERRPPPREGFSHDTGAIAPAPLGSTVPTLPPACDAVRTTKLVASGDGVLRLRSVLQQVCTLASGGAGDDVTTAARALAGATLRFGGFTRTGVESTTDFSSRTIWLNIKFAIRSTPVEELVPVVLHDAWHLAHADEPVTALQELRARRVELAVCRNLVPIDDWPRWCEDSRALGEMPEARALTLLIAAGYEG